MNCETPVKTVMPPAGSAPALCPVRPRALIADDQSDVLEALRLLLKHDGYEVEVANSPATVLDPRLYLKRYAGGNSISC